MNTKLRTKIIHEAYKLFIVKGIKSTSLNDIMKSINKSKGALAYYFPSKEMLIRTVVDTCFFPASRIPSEWEHLSKMDVKLFLDKYRNPIDRAIHGFPFPVDDNKLMAYMQFVASAHEYVADFIKNYQKLLEEEDRFLDNVIQTAVHRGELSMEDAGIYQERFFRVSIGQTFTSYFL